jgi:MerR family transcriptional regulator, copper efflux regulator
MTPALHGPPEPRYLSAGELIRDAGCTRKALRVYQAHGLLKPARRRGPRRYDIEAHHRLRLVIALRALDLSLDDIRTLFEVRVADGPEGPAGPVAGRLASELAELVRQVSQRLDQLVQVRQRLVVARDNLLACATCAQPLTACSECAANGRLDAASRVLLTGENDPPR